MTVKFSNLKQACEQHIRNIKNQTVAYRINNEDAIKVRKEISLGRANLNQQLEERVMSGLSSDRLRAHELSKLSGANSNAT